MHVDVHGRPLESNTSLASVQVELTLLYHSDPFAMARQLNSQLQYIISIVRSHPSPPVLTSLILLVTVHPSIAISDGTQLAIVLAAVGWNGVADALCGTFRKLEKLKLGITGCPRKGLFDAQMVVERIPDAFLSLVAECGTAVEISCQ